jgi:hypothetical protein
MNRHTLTRLFIFLTLVLIISISAPLTAQACRECPFPGKIAQGKWLMPNGLMVIEISETAGPAHTTSVEVILRDSRTGALVASGESRIKTGDKVLNISLADTNGKPIAGYVHFMDADRDKIEVKFTCSAGVCALDELL